MKHRLLHISALLFASLQAFAQTTYTYDNLNRLTKVVYPDGTTISYTFDALGNRTRKTVTGAHIVEPTSAYVWLSGDGKTLTFCYDDQKSQRDGTTYELNSGSENPAWNPNPQNSNLTSVTAVVFDKAFAEVKPTSTYSWFYYLKNLSDISGLQYLNTTEVTDMYSMFRECKSLKNVDVSKFNTAKVTSMAYMFYNCSGLTNLDVSSFNIANVKNSTEMFSGCSGLTSFSISASMSSLDQRACNGIGSTSKPCSIEAPEGFNFGVDTSGDYFIWKKGYFRVESGVTGISVEKPNQILFIGESANLNYTILPSSATNKNVTWKSSDNTVVKVEQTSSGYTAVAQKVGTATLTVTTVEGGKTAIIKIEVRAHVESINLTTQSLTINRGNTVDLSQYIKSVLPENAYDKSVKWTSSNTSVVSISGSSATAKATGSCRVTATSVDNPQVTASMTITVEAVASGIYVNNPVQTVWVGEDIDLSYYFEPADATSTIKSWTSSDASVVAVSGSNTTSYRAVAQKAGTAVLTVTADNGQTATIQVTVRAHVTSILLSTESVTVNKGSTTDLSQFISSVLPEDAYDKSVKWTSSNTSVVSISGSSATAKATGSCRVTATSVDNPQVTANITITVEAVATGIYVNNPVQTVWIGEDVDLSYYFEPADATSTIKSWTSSDASVVAVSGSNTTSYRAVAQKSGTAVLTVTADNGQTATIQVTVRAHVTSILLSTESVTVNKGSTTDLSQFISAILPEDAYDKSVKWTSSNTSVVSISGSSATAKATGSCRVTATSVDNPQVTANITITVEAVASGIYVNNPVQTVWIGEDVDLSYYFEPADATSTIKSWTSSDASVVAVSGSNTTSYRAVAQKSGTAVLTVTADNGQTATIQVTVRAHVTSILLSTESVTVNKGSTTDLSQFISAILPEDAYDKSVKWAVTDTSTVVTISQSNSVWQMTANREGYATLKISSVDNPQATAFLLVTIVTNKPHNGDVNNDGDVNQQDLYALVDAYLDNAQATLYTDIDGDGSLSVADITKLVEIINPGSSTQETIVNGHEYVDLGLPSGTLWATCNVGATKPEEFGGRYAWGETETKEKFNWSNYIHCDGTKETCHDIGSNISGTEYDVAFVKWGGPWQMPTSDQLKELKANCRYEWTTLNGVSGGKLTGPNGNSIFIPSTGTSVTDGVCWSSTADYENKSYRMRFEEAIVITGSYSRDVGYPVRPVIASNNPFENEDLQSIVNNLINNMVNVEGGSFTMGATDGWGYEDERPVHEVTLSPYKISRYEVTQQLWNAVMGSNPSSFIGDNLPVNNVSWNECTEFIQKLNNLTSAVFDDEFCLPTEARWEFAARGGILGKDLEQGNGYQYSGGYNNIENMESYVWCSDNSDGTTHAVGSKKPNELGLYDMSGNVCEYVQDYFSESYTEEAQTDPIGVSEADAHIYRGGSFNRPKWQCRLASRYGAKPDEKLKECGLRLATRAQTIDVEDVTLYPNQPSDITISLTGMKKCIATSFIVELPEGSFRLSNGYLGAGTPLVGCFNDDHVVISKSLDDKTMRVVIYSPSNSVFKGGWVSDGEPQEAEPGGDPNISGGGRHMPSAQLKAKESLEEGTDLFKLNITAEGMDFGTYQGNIKNVQLTLKDLRLVSLPDIVYQLTLQEDTDIIDINVDAEQNDIWYDLSGRRIIYQPDSKGVYIKNGQKVVVSK